MLMSNTWRLLQEYFIIRLNINSLKTLKKHKREKTENRHNRIQ